MGSIDETSDRTALVSIGEALPELRAERFAKVREWDAARMALEGEYEAADGEYLIKIRDALKPTRGLWQAYLSARGIPYQTALDRIHKAEGHIVTSRKNTESVFLPPPQPVPAWIAPASVTITPQEPDGWPPAPDDRDDDDGWPPEDQTVVEAATPTVRQPAQLRGLYSIKTWGELSQVERAALIMEGRSFPRGALNKQETGSIEWARWSWNPVTGCLHNCPYCYARDIANRFYPQGFTPTFLPERLGAPLHHAVPAADAEHELGWRNIFTCSMADLFGKWVPAEWIEAVLEVIRDAPQWNFLLLTKFPNRLAEFTFPDNAWLGTSVDCQARVKNAERSFAKVKGGVKWLSCEPLLEPLHFDALDMFDWVVIGGASKSNETPEWVPPLRWVRDLEARAREAGCMVYEKTNLDPRLREYPGWERPEPVLPDALKYLPTIG